MSGLFVEPFRYTFDTSALIDLKRLYPRDVFKALWDNFEKLCLKREVISVKEVYNEIKRGSDELTKWADKFKQIFLTPNKSEIEYVANLQLKYPYFVDIDGDRPVADPFIIASAKEYGLIIIQQEKIQHNKQKIPFVAKQEGVTCVSLVEFFQGETWEF